MASRIMRAVNRELLFNYDMMSLFSGGFPAGHHQPVLLDRSGSVQHLRPTDIHDADSLFHAAFGDLAVQRSTPAGRIHSHTGFRLRGKALRTCWKKPAATVDVLTQQQLRCRRRVRCSKKRIRDNRGSLACSFCRNCQTLCWCFYLPLYLIH